MKYTFKFLVDPSNVPTRLLDAMPMAVSSLWIMPDNYRLSPDDLEFIIGSFPGLRCVLWRLGSPSNMPEELQNKNRAYSTCPELVGGFIAQTTQSFGKLVKSLDFRNAQKIYSDVVWLAPGQWEAFAKFISHTRFGIDATIAMLPPDDVIAQQWSVAMIGMYWLAMDLGRHSNIPPTIPVQSVVRAVLTFGISLGGIAVSVCEDSDTKRALVFWGPKVKLEQVTTHLGLQTNSLSGDEFDRWTRRGVEFKM